MLRWTLVYIHLFELVFLFSSEKYSEVKLLDDVVAVFFIFGGNSILFSLVAAPMHSPTNSAPGVRFLQILAQHLSAVSLVTVLLTGVRWRRVVLLMCVSWMASDECLFMCLSVTCQSPFSSLETCLFRSSATFFNQVVCFVLFWCWVVWVLCILWTLTP